MCGVFGVLGLDASTYSDSDIETTLQSMHHRGPDAKGVFKSPCGRAILGHTRLSIIDLSDKATQPLVNDRKALVYNGEIYNYRDLKSTWPKPDGGYKSKSDTEVLLQGLSVFGLKALNCLRGMYAGAYFENEEISLFRDPMGIKPLYYYKTASDSLVFASEIKTLVTMLKNITFKVNIEALGSYLRYENWGQKQSLFEGIQQLEPGEILTYYLANSKIFSTNIQSKVERFFDDQSSAKDIYRFIESTIGEHLTGDVPIGVYLSGGIDSSLVATIASRHLDSVKGFTGFFSGLGTYYDETPYVDLVAKKNSIKVEKIEIGPRDFLASFDKMIYALDEPRMGMGAFSQYVVAQKASKTRKVILAGHGGDELFAGYKMFKGFWISENTQDKSGLFKSLNKPGEWPWLGYYFGKKWFTSKLTFAPRIFRNISIDRGQEILFEEAVHSQASKALRRYFNQVYLPGLLVVEDKISMAHSLETRVPLCSYQLQQGLDGLSLSRLMLRGELKGFLKDLFKEDLPRELLAAPKRGFPTPLRIWFRQELFDFVYDRLVSSDTVVRRLFSPKEIRDLVLSHKKNPLPFVFDEIRAHKIWILLSLDSWSKQFPVSWEGVENV